MKRITLLSDTHGFMDKLILKYTYECDEIWHAGDIGNLEVMEQFDKNKPMRAVFGNIDGTPLRVIYPEVQLFDCEEAKVLIKHIGGYPSRWDSTLLPYLKNTTLNLVITGHSHILKVIYDRKFNFLHINPGAAGIHGFHSIRTLVRFTIDKSKIEDLEVVELGPRG